jgi:hypothetical protein
MNSIIPPQVPPRAYPHQQQPYSFRLLLPPHLQQEFEIFIPCTLLLKGFQILAEIALQYNAVMLMRILVDNPGHTFTRNFDAKFVTTIKELLYLRMRRAASLAALGLDSAVSTILGRWTNSVPCWSDPAGTPNHTQYNAVMLMRILVDNPGHTFTRNFESSA